MEKKLHSEMVNSQAKKMTKILFIAALVLGSVNISAQMKYFLNQTATHTSTTAVPGDFDFDFDGDGSKDFEINANATTNSLPYLRIKGKKSPSWGEVLGQADLVTIDGTDFDIPTTFATAPASAETDITWKDRNSQTILYFDATDPTFGDGNTYGVVGDQYIAIRFVKDGTGSTGNILGDTYYGWMHLTITDKDNWSINAWGYNTKIGAPATDGVPVGDEIHFLNQNLTSTTAVPGDFDLDFDGDGSKEFEVNLLNTGILRIKGKKSPSWGEVLGEAATVTVGTDEFDIPTIFGAVTTKGPDDVTWNDRNTTSVLYYDTGDTNIGNNGILGQAGEVYLAVTFIKGGEIDDMANDAYYGWVHLTITDANNWQINSYGYNPTAMLSPGYVLSTQKNEFSNDVIVFNNNNTVNIKNIPEDSSYQLFAITGQAIKIGSIKRGDASFDVENLSRGLYVLKIVGQESGKLLTAKLLF